MILASQLYNLGLRSIFCWNGLPPTSPFRMKELSILLRSSKISCDQGRGDFMEAKGNSVHDPEAPWFWYRHPKRDHGRWFLPGLSASYLITSALY